MLTTIEDFKPLVGRDILALPTGNNARGGKGKEPVKFHVNSVGRKYVKLSQYYSDGKGLMRSVAYCPRRGCTQEAANSGFGLNEGYDFFATEEGVNSHIKQCEMKNEINQYFRGMNSLSEASFRDVETIYNIIKGLKQ